VLAKLKSINPWIAVFVFLSLFHITRGSFGDATIFVLASAILILEKAGKFSRLHTRKPNLGRGLVVALSVVVGVILFVSPRHSLLDAIVLLALLPTSLYLIWQADVGAKPKALPQVRRAKFVWFYLILAISVVEIFAFYMSIIVDNDFIYPTISVVMDAPLDNPVGRAIWIIVWVLSGISLLRIWRKSN
jgi:hypothetical protein